VGDTETPRIHKYGESKTTRIMMATVRHVTSGLGRTKISGSLDLCRTGGTRGYAHPHLLSAKRNSVTHCLEDAAECYPLIHTQLNQTASFLRVLRAKKKAVYVTSLL
jgi:hypothetical protein